MVSPVTDRPMTGTIRMAVSPASADPSAQLPVAIRSGDQPSEAAAPSFSATALVPRPNRVRL